jgi:hypothetical protein
MKNTMLWVFTIVLTIVAVFYTRLTGPTVPVRGSIEIAGEEISYHLIRTFAEPTDATVSLTVPNENITGYFRYRRTPSHDDWAEAPLIRQGDQLLAILPQQPPAGHIAYQITLQSGNETVTITDKPVLIRFRGSVPAWALLPHILLMFATIFTGIRAGLAAFFSDKTRLLTTLTFIFLVAGGLIFGPIVQKYAFGDWWTGWPFGTDLTDNKTAVMFIFWLIALIRVRKNPHERWWVIVATIAMLIAYMIPHSLMGSQIDFREQP